MDTQFAHIETLHRGGGGEGKVALRRKINGAAAGRLEQKGAAGANLEGKQARETKDAQQNDAAFLSYEHG